METAFLKILPAQLYCDTENGSFWKQMSCMSYQIALPSPVFDEVIFRTFPILWTNSEIRISQKKKTKKKKNFKIITPAQNFSIWPVVHNDGRQWRCVITCFA